MVSVCMATYNGAEYIKGQIDSILCQLGEEDELIISDDGSTDSTLSILSFYQQKDSRVKVFQHNGRCYTKNFENAIEHAAGDYIFLCDQDDLWEIDKVETTLKAFHVTNADLLISDATLVDKDNNIIIQSAFEHAKTKTGFIHNLVATSYIGACMAFRKEVLERVLPIPGKDKYIAHDYWIACICERYYKTALINKPLILYRRHGDNTSPAFGKSRLSLMERVYKRFYTVYYLCRRKKPNSSDTISKRIISE